MGKIIKSRLWVLLFLLVTQLAMAEISYSDYNENQGVSDRDTVSKRPLILWIHGCHQKEADFVAATDIVEKTKSLNPIIIAPYQKKSMLNCWNFFSKEMRKRDGKFMDVVKEVQKRIDSGEADPDRIFVGGFSSGAVFAQQIALCYPDVFKGALIHSGAPFDSAKGMMSPDGVGEGAKEALACADSAKPRRLKNILYMHGKKDYVLPYTLGLKAFGQAVHYIDMLDDQIANQSYEIKQAQDKNTLRLAVKFPDGTRLNFIRIEKMMHRWSGGRVGFSFSSPDTISSVDAFLDMTNGLQ